MVSSIRSATPSRPGRCALPAHSGVSTYEPRNPESSVVVRVLREHLSEFEEAVEQHVAEAEEPSGSDDASVGTKGLPPWVVSQLRAMASCGDFLRGFTVWQCGTCERHRIIPFSCKTRVCSSCAARRMNDTAAWLTDRILVRGARWRQYVVTFPAPLAVGLCFRSALASAVTRLSIRVLFGHQRRRAPASEGRPHPAAVVWLQRFSDALGCWFHLHALLPDGVFRERPGSLDVEFESQPAPTHAEMECLVRTLSRRVLGLLRRRAAADPADAPLLEQLASAPEATRHRDPTPPPSRVRPAPRLCVRHDDFTLHAATSVAPGDTQALERLIRYVARPPVSEDRLRELDDGRIQLRLKRARRDGVRAVTFTPVSFIARLAALIPPPGANQVLYFGALATGSPLRRHILPEPPASTPQRPTAPPRPTKMPHRDLLKRVFLADVTRCPCGGVLTVVDVVEKPDVVQAVLAAIILCDQAPPRAPPT